jgi:hypothetical protein
MGFLAPRPAPFDLAQWQAKPHHHKIKPLAQDWALGGFGTPYAVYLLYVIKLVIFVLAAIAIVGTTRGLGGFSHVHTWWTQPVAYEKFATWTLLWEILGLGCGSMPLTFRFLPPIGGALYFLRPGTMRLPPWPDRIPLTRGTTRTPYDVGVYLGVIVSAVILLTLDPRRSGAYAGEVNPLCIAILLAFLTLVGLRDKATFLAARPEQYATVLIVFLFHPGSQLMALKFVMLAIWWGAATSKLNKHFPFVVSVMISNSPLQVSKRIKQRLWVDYPNDMRPSRLSAAAAHGGTVIEYTVPLILIFARGGTVTDIAVIIMIAFHAHITSTFPLGVPLEWNLWVIYSLLVLFHHYAAVGFSSFGSPLLGIVLVLLLVGLPVLGNMRPDLVSFLPSMRYYAGNWASSTWLFRNDGAEDVLDSALTKPAPIVVKQLQRLYGDEMAGLLMYKGLTFRAMHSHGRALLGLIPRAVDDVADYTVREGELVAGIALGWNFGEGHLHDRQLLAAIQERCKFAPGRLRVITLESQSMGRPRQHYRILDAADGLIEEGYVEVRDMVALQPWLSDDDATIPVHPLIPPVASA